MKTAIVLFETSATMTQRLHDAGYDVVSVDCLPRNEDTDCAAPHIVCDIWAELELRHSRGDALVSTIPNPADWTRKKYDLIVAHPPCTYLASSGLHWNKRNAKRAEQTEQALRDTYALQRWALNHLRDDDSLAIIENPVGAIRRVLGPATCFVQPFEHGHCVSKNTGLWTLGRKVSPIEPTKRVEPAYHVTSITGKRLPRYDNQAPCGADKRGPSADRWKERSKTYAGIADAIMSQWVRA